MLWCPVIFTGSLQGRISTQGDPCNLYRERVCSEFICYQIFSQFLWLFFLTIFWQIHLFISEWCARLYENGNYKGWTQEIHEEDQVEISKDRNDELSAVKVKNGCKLYLYRHYGLNELVGIVTKHNPFLKNYNDQISSLKCECKGIMSTGLWNFSFGGSKLNIWPKNNELKRTCSNLKRPKSKLSKSASRWFSKSSFDPPKVKFHKWVDWSRLIKSHYFTKLLISKLINNHNNYFFNSRPSFL